MSNRTCGNCRWWLDEKDTAGQCRRHPPSVPEHSTKYPTWPVTDSNAFCGEWADAAITPEQDERRELVRRFAVAIVAADSTGATLKYMDHVWQYAEGLADAEPKA